MQECSFKHRVLQKGATDKCLLKNGNVCVMQQKHFVQQQKYGTSRTSALVIQTTLSGLQAKLILI